MLPVTEHHFFLQDIIDDCKGNNEENIGLKTRTSLSYRLCCGCRYEKNCCSFGFCPNQGGGAAQIFCHIFISVFLANKRSLFPPKSANNLNFKLFLGLYMYEGQNKYRFPGRLQKGAIQYIICQSWWKIRD